MLDLDGEVRESAVALDFAEAGLGFELPAAVQRRHMSPELAVAFGEMLYYVT